MSVAHNVLYDELGAIHFKFRKLRRHDLWSQRHGALDGERVHAELLCNRKRLLDHFNDTKGLSMYMSILCTACPQLQTSSSALKQWQNI